MVSEMSRHNSDYRSDDFFANDPQRSARPDDESASDKAQEQNCRPHSIPFRDAGMAKKKSVSGIYNFGETVVAAFVWAVSMCAVIIAGSVLMLD